MKPCRSAWRKCHSEAVLTARITGVGDRDLCQHCHDALVAIGQHFRVLEPNAFIPEWRQRSLLRDQTALTEPVL